MILPPFAEDDNEDFATITRPYFDDHRVRREHALQRHLKQLAPTMVDGGRAILWYCHLCQKPWFEYGRTASFVRLSQSQISELAQDLGVKVSAPSSLPSSMCPLCASLHLGGMPRIREYQDGQGYRFTWEARTSRNTRLFCIVYRWNLCSISDMLLEVGAAPCDVLITSLEQVRSMLAWMKVLQEPGKDEVMRLNESNMNNVYGLDTPAPGFSWCGYAWQTHCHSLGDILVALGITFPDSSICSPSLLVACWRHIACEIERVQVC